MPKKSPERVQFDLMVDQLYPFLPKRYVGAVQALRPDMDPKRLHDVVRKRGTEPDWPAYSALAAVKKTAPVGRPPRKKHCPRSSAMAA